MTDRALRRLLQAEIAYDSLLLLENKVLIFVADGKITLQTRYLHVKYDSPDF